jgi:hypothetical protein
VWLWLVGMVGIALIRGLLYLLCRADLQREDGRSHWPVWSRWHDAGVILAGLQWAALAWWGVPYYQGVDRFTILIVLAALAGGATANLAPSRLVGKLFILLVLLPACWQLGHLGDTANLVFAVLGAIFAWVMVSGHESTYQVLRQIVALDLEKEALVVALSARSSEAMQANADLERRVADRTRALLYKTQHDTLTRLLNRRGMTEAHRRRQGGGRCLGAGPGQPGPLQAHQRAQGTTGATCCCARWRGACCPGWSGWRPAAKAGRRWSAAGAATSSCSACVAAPARPGARSHGGCARPWPSPTPSRAAA